MKEKCYALRTSILILIFAGVFTAILYFLAVPNSFEKIKDFSIIILGGATSGSVATSIIYSVEYNVTKRSTLEEYYISAIKVLNQFSKLQYFHTNEPPELLIEYFKEELNNDYARELHNPDTDIYSINHHVRDRWCEELRQAFSELEKKMDKNEFENFIIKQVEDKAKQYIYNMNSIIDLYIELAQTSYSEVESIYGQMCYFLDFTGKKRNETYNDIHEPLRAKLLDIKKIVVFHLKPYRNGKIVNTPVILIFLLELQNKIFNVKTKQNDIVTKLHNNDFYNEMYNNLEKFRAQIYGTKHI